MTKARGWHGPRGRSTPPPVLAVVVLVTALLLGVCGPVGATTTGATGGTVTRNGEAVAGAGVWLYRADAKVLVKATTTAIDGRWSISGLAPGTYRLLVWGGPIANPSWYPAKVAWEDATNVDVVAGATTVIDPGVPVGGALAGSVRAEGVPTAGLLVTIYRNNIVARRTTTGADGTWSVTGLAPGPYQLMASDPARAHLDRWYPAASQPPNAAAVVVEDGSSHTGLDVDLPGAGAIAGRVTTTGDEPVAGVSVLALGGYGFPLGAAMAAADGTYRIAPLPPGTYRVTLFDSTSSWAATFAPDAPDYASGTTYPVTAGATTTADVGTWRFPDVPVPPYTGDPSAPAVAVIGDSITQLGTTQLLQGLTSRWWTSVRGLGSRRVGELLPVAGRYAATDPSQVVINLGTNDAVQAWPIEQTEADLETMIDLFPDASCIHLVTISTSSRYPQLARRADQVNALLRRVAAERPQVRIVDWATVLEAHMADGQSTGGWTFDGVHLGAAGIDRLAAMIDESLASCPTPPGRIVGTAFVDLDGDGAHDVDEPGQAGLVVRARRDSDADGVVDATAAVALSGPDGSFELGPLAEGDVVVDLDPVAASPATPSTPDGMPVAVPGGGTASTTIGVLPVVGAGSRESSLFSSTGGSWVRAVAAGPDGTLVAGRFSGTMTLGDAPGSPVMTSAGATDGFVASLDATGALRWAHRLGSPGIDELMGVAVAADGTVAVSGISENPAVLEHRDGALGLPTAYDAVLAVYEPDGALRWARTASGGAISLTLDVAFAADGSLIAATTFSGHLDVGTSAIDAVGSLDGAVAAHDAETGAVRWLTHLGSPGRDIVMAVEPQPGGDLVVTGTAGSGTATIVGGGGGATVALDEIGGEDMVVARLTGATGAPVDGRRLGGAGTDNAWGLDVDQATGDIYLGGSLGADATIDGQAVAATDDGAIVALASDLSLRWVRTLTSPTASAVVDLDARDGTVVAAGAFGGDLEIDGVRRRAVRGKDAVLVELDGSGSLLGLDVMAGQHGDDVLLAVDRRADGTVLAGGSFVGAARVGVGAGSLALASDDPESAVLVTIRPPAPSP